MIAYELPDDRGPTRAQCRRDGRAATPTASDLRAANVVAVAEVRRRVRLGSVVSQWARGRLTLAQAVSRARVRPAVIFRMAWEGRV